MAKKTATTNSRRRAAAPSRAAKSGAKSKSKSNSKPTAGAAASGAPGVRVRMYRQGLGDCFLITFNVGADEKHMLIDCGTLGNAATDVKISDVMKDILVETKRLEILVATHAHKDHVSGFLSEQKSLDQIEIKNVWMGWTEDPHDELAKKLGNTAQALRAAIVAAYGSPLADDAMRDKIRGVVEFEGLEVDAGGNLAMGDTIAQALDVVRKFPGASLTYHSPGGPAIELPEIPGFRFYVLGPPRDAAKLANMGDYGSDELYGLASAIGAHADPFGDAATDTEAPFDARFCYPVAHADQFFADYARSDERYRRIDAQWMDAAAELAAKFDNFRNNTSLALAIERIADGAVLLFPADAQQGNWLSWHDPGMQWKVKNAAGDVQTVTAADLLARTKFYKVGHHCSHNATAKGKGLEIMRKNKDLTAFIPVDRAIALKKSPPGSWKMPAVPLFRQLLDACSGRVVRADLGWAADAKGAGRVEQELLDLAKPQEWADWKTTQSKTANVTVGPLHVDYTLD